jgi:hypothetical protein
MTRGEAALDRLAAECDHANGTAVVPSYTAERALARMGKP